MSPNNIAEKYTSLREELDENGVQLVAVSKTHPPETIMKVYELGHRHFGENRLGELIEKNKNLPEDIRWHFIGNIQSKKIKDLLPIVHLIQSVDRFKLLRVIQKESEKINVKTNILIQPKIAEEESKSGFSFDEASRAIDDLIDNKYPNINLMGLMGMATFTRDESQLKREFLTMQKFFHQKKSESSLHDQQLQILSIGMSGDYHIAVQYNSNMVRVGSLIFGPRN